MSVCNIIPFIARKESLEKLTIVDFFITVILFVNRSCWNQHNTIWSIKLNCKVDNLTSCYIAVHCLNFELCVYLLIMCAFVQNTINVLDVHFHFSNHQLSISEQEQLQKQLFHNEMTTIEAVKNESPPPTPIRNTLLVQWLKLGI